MSFTHELVLALQATINNLKKESMSPTRWFVRLKFIILSQLFIFCFTFPVAGHGADDPPCESLLDSSLFDIRSYGKTGKEAVSESSVLDFRVVTDHGDVALTARAQEDGRIFYQVIQRRGGDPDVLRVLYQELHEWIGLPSNAKRELGYMGPSLSPMKLRQRFEALRGRFKKGLSTHSIIPRSLKVANSMRVDALRALLVGYLEKNGLNEEQRFYDLRLGLIHRDLINELSTVERVFFDYAIFEDFLGFEATERAEEATLKWRTLNPDSQVSFEEVHKGIRGKFLNLARQSQKRFRSMVTYRLTSFEKVEELLKLWRSHNSEEDLLRMEEISRKPELNREDLNWVLERHRSLEPKIPFVFRESLRRIVRLDLFQDSFAKVELDHLRELLAYWSKKMSKENVARVDQIINQGFAAEDLNFILTDLKHILLPGLTTWELSELRTLHSGKRVENLTPFGLQVDHSVRNLDVKVELSISDRVNHSGGLDSYGGGSYTVPFSSHARRTGPSYDSAKDYFGD
ncbi:hypothetical protein GW916_02005 [bacterium]|nr:hypothetical protein [bacterium]